MKLSAQARLAALEMIGQRSDVLSGLGWFYGDPDDMAPAERERAIATREKIIRLAWPDFGPDGEPINNRGRDLMEPRF